MENPYRSILMQGEVLVKVPIESHDMRFMTEHEFYVNGESVKVPDRWQNGMAIGSVILNRHFYGFSRADLGKKIVAMVDVVEKTAGDGRKFIMLDICKESNGTKPACQMKITEEQDGVSILGTKKFICFKPL